MNMTPPLRPQPVALNRLSPRESSPATPSTSTTPPRTTQPEQSRAARLLDQVVTWSITALFFGLPVFFTGTTLQGLAFEKQLFFYLFVLIAVAAWLLKGMITGELQIRRTFLDIPIALFFVAYVISALLSVDWWRSFWGGFTDPSRGVLNILAMILAYYLILSNFTPRRFLVWLGALIASAYVLMLWSYLVFLGIHFLPSALERYTPISLLGTTRSLAFFFAAMLPLFIVAIMQISKRTIFGKALSIFLGLGLVATIVLLAPLYNFVPWPAILIGLGIFAVFILAQVVRPEGNQAWLPLATLVLVFFVVMFGEVDFFKVNPPVEASPNTALSWTIIRGAVANNFFFGSGPGTFGYDFSLYRPVEYNYNIKELSQFRFAQGQGILFEAIPTIGVVGTFFLLILMLTLVSFGFYVLSHNKEYNKLYSLGLWSSFLILVGGACLIPINSALVSLSALMIALALAVLLWESRIDPVFWRLSLRVSPKFALVSAFILLVATAGLIFLFTFIGRAFAADILAQKAVIEIQKTNQDTTATARMTRAINLMPKESQYRVTLAQLYLALATMEANKPSQDRNLTVLTNAVNAATQLLEDARAASPKDIGIRESLAQAYESKIVLAGPTKELLDPVQAAYEQAMALEPSNPIFFLKLGQIHESRASILKGDEQKKEIEKAKEYFQQSIDKQGTFAPGYLNLALAKEMAGNSRDESIDLLKKALTYDQKNIDIAYQLGRFYRLRGSNDDVKQAEDIFNAILKADSTNQNARINLGLLYEATKRKDEAVKEYQTILDMLPGDDETTQTTRKQLQVLIDNVRSGKSNLVADTKTPAPESVSPAAPGESSGTPQ